MSRKNRRNRERRPEVKQETGREVFLRSGIAATFGEKVGVDMRSTDDLMNWLIFGDDKHYYGSRAVNDGF